VTDDDGWQVEVTTAARRDLRRLDPPVRARVLAAVKGLLSDPAEGDIKRLVGVDPAEWRLRVGDWRVRFTRHDDQRLVVIKRVLPRGRAYRD
jgi:mRNA interferase RelE/StbE